jgi:hypothetical protein
MSSGADRASTPDGDDRFAKEMLLQVREVDPEANADAVQRYAREIAEAEEVLQTLDLDPSSVPPDVAFSPDWTKGRTS